MASFLFLSFFLYIFILISPNSSLGSLDQLDTRVPILDPLSLARFDDTRVEKDGDVWVHRAPFLIRGPYRSLQKESVEFFSFFDQIIRILYIQELSQNVNEYFKVVSEQLNYIEKRYKQTSYVLEEWTAAFRLACRSTRFPTMTVSLLLSVYNDELFELQTITVRQH